jgi:hypothetical protein
MIEIEVWICGSAFKIWTRYKLNGIDFKEVVIPIVKYAYSVYHQRHRVSQEGE